MHKPVFLTGCMGSGKSTVGRLLAQTLGAAFIDVDQEIETRSGRSISTIFAQSGEKAFRDIETRVLLQIIQEAKGAVVIATGGGIVLREENRKAMAQAGTVFYLKAAPETLTARAAASQDRPLLKTENPKETMRRILSERAPLYETGQEMIDTDQLNAIQTAQQIAERLSWSCS